METHGSPSVDLMTDESSRLLFLVSLGDGFPVAAEVLGTWWELLGGPRAAQLVMPSAPLSAEGFGRPLSRPLVPMSDRALNWFERSRPGGFHVVGGSSAAERSGSPQEDAAPPGLGFWGRATAVRSQTGEVSEATVQRAVVVTSPHESGDEQVRRHDGNRFGVVVDAWIDCVAEWLEVLCDIDLRARTASERECPRHVYPLPVVTRADGSGSRYPTMDQLGTMSRFPFHSTLRNWRQATIEANRSKAPPLEYLLLRDARAASMRDERRKAVIDASTAMEVALSGFIRTRFTGSEGTTGRAIRVARGLVDLYDLAAALGASTTVGRDRVMNLSGKRNDAAHGGVIPAEGDVKVSLNAATSLLADVSQLVGVEPPDPTRGTVQTRLTVLSDES
jgi:hypothetical protein